MHQPTSKRHIAARLISIIAVVTGTASALAQPGGIQIETQWVFDADAAHPGTTVRAAIQVTLQEKFHVQSHHPLDEFLIPTTLTVTPPQGFTVLKVVYPEPIMLHVPGYEEPQPGFEQAFVIGVVLEVAKDTAPGVYPIKSVLGYQACDDRICLAPATKDVFSALKVVPESQQITKAESSLLDGINFSLPGGPNVTPTRTDPIATTPDDDLDIMAELEDFTILGTQAGYLRPKAFIAFIDGAETGTLQGNMLDDKGPLIIVLLVILGGIALNLTPCVLPLIPINIAIIGAGARAGSRTRGFALGGTYGLAMAAVYGALGLIVTLTTATFGAINSTIWFNIAIAILFVVLGLAMFDLIHIDFSKFQSKINVTGGPGKGSFALAFGMGAVAALLAGACVAPVVIQVVVYAADQYEKGTKIALALPFFLGLGMALPWPFAGAGLSVLPKPGVWMVRVRQAMGVFILAFAAYYGYLAWEIYDSTNVDPKLVNESVQEQLEEGWIASPHQGLAQAKAEGKLVFIDMWAVWCKACSAMNATTLKDEQVVARLADYVKIKYEAEDLDSPPALDVLTLFGGKGLPHYAILQPKPADTGIDESQ